jgi:ABC-type microcin C transport system duplicated ATPase subunit YejF
MRSTQTLSKVELQTFFANDMSSPQPAITIETQILEYRKYQHEKKDKEDFTRNTAVKFKRITN